MSGRKHCHINGKFWIKSSERTLLVVAAPHQRGHHGAKKSRAFVPIIDELAGLHEKGFAHGDIRAFNTLESRRMKSGRRGRKWTDSLFEDARF